MSLPSPEAVDALFAPSRGARGVLLAISGGPDSTALLLLTARWARGPDRPPLFAATVDHGLRAEGAEEARSVAALCARLGVPHATLAWKDDKPKTRIQERARDARYALLFDHARALGADHVVTAHHLDDQAETVLFRLMRGSGVAGLAGMSRTSPRGELTLFRPLLGLAKAELVAICEEAGEPYARDPSNVDPRYARPRLRALMGALAAEGLDAKAFSRLAARAARAERALNAAAESAEARLGLAANLTCDGAALFAEPDEIVRRLLTRAVARAGGWDAGRIGLEKMEALAEALREAQEGGARFSANVAGARVKRDARGRISVGPEPRRGVRDPAVPTASGDRAS